MDTHYRWIAVFSAIGGLLLTFLTGMVNVTIPGLLGAEWYGFPAAWLIRTITAPQYFPWHVQAIEFAIDLVFWSVMVCIILVAAKLLVIKKPARKRPSRKRAARKKAARRSRKR